MTKFEKLIYETNDNVATITLNDPAAANALSSVLRDELRMAFRVAEIDKTVRVVIITGAGNVFSAGANLTDMPTQENWRVDDTLLDSYFPMLDAIATSSKIYICAAQGGIAGISGAMAMQCDLTIMADEAYIYQPFHAINLVPDGGLHWHLAQHVGYKRAMEMIVLGERITAAQCLDWGLCNRVVAKDEVLKTALEIAAKINAGAPMAQAASKRILRGAMKNTLTETFQHEATEQITLFESQDFPEGVKAFFEKRKPVFSGK